MTIALGAVIAGLAVLLAGLIAADASIRHRTRRADQRERAFLPGAERAIATYLAGSPEIPEAAGEEERALLLRAGLEALGDLRGSERSRLAGLLDEQLGYVAGATAALASRKRAVRRRAAETLAVIATPGTLPGLRAGLADHDPLVRGACARTLAEIGGDDDTAAVLAVAERDARLAPGQAAAVVLSLGASRPGALAPLLAATASPRVRAIAIAVTGALRLAQHGLLLRGCLAERDDLAAAAARGLGAIGDIEAVGALKELAGDERRSFAARAAAATALGEIGDVSALPALEPLLRSGDWSLCAAVAYALAGLGVAGEAALRRAAGSGQAPVRELAGAVLGS